MIDLAAAGRRVKDAEKRRADAMQDLRQGIVENKTAGVSVSEIARRAGVTRQTVYTILEEESREIHTS